jgi:hypothetical protein
VDVADMIKLDGAHEGQLGSRQAERPTPHPHDGSNRYVRGGKLAARRAAKSSSSRWGHGRYASVPAAALPVPAPVPVQCQSAAL